MRTSLWRREHVPERDAAAYLAGELRPRSWERFEAHLLECEECWSEVRLGRRGRALAELGREIAPASLREDVRAALALSGEGARGPRRAVPAVAGAMIAVLVATSLAVVGLVARRGPRQPGPIAAALERFRSDTVPESHPTDRPAPDLSGVGLVLAASGRSVLGGYVADLFVYRAPGDQRVFLLLSDRLFPEARGARARTGASHGWTAVDDGVVLVCSTRPVSYLLLGVDAPLLAEAEAALAAQPAPAPAKGP